MENTEQNARTYVEVNSPYEGIDKEVIIRLLLDFANQQLRIKVDKYGKELSDSIESAIAIEISIYNVCTAVRFIITEFS